MKTLMKSDFFFLHKTSKFIIFATLIFMFSILSPLTARYMNEILEALLSTSDELVITFPDTSILDSYFQYIGDLNEIILWVILFVGVSIFIRDKSKGQMPLIMSKPINRTKYLVSKYTSFSILLFGLLSIGYLVFSYYTNALYHELLFIDGLVMMLYYFVYIEFLLAVALLMSILFDTYILAILFTFLVYIISNVLNMLSDLTFFSHLPGMLNSEGVEYLVTEGVVDGSIITLIVGIGLTIVLIVLSTTIFRKQELA